MKHPTIPSPTNKAKASQTKLHQQGASRPSIPTNPRGWVTNVRSQTPSNPPRPPPVALRRRRRNEDLHVPRRSRATSRHLTAVSSTTSLVTLGNVLWYDQAPQPRPEKSISPTATVRSMRSALHFISLSQSAARSEGGYTRRQSPLAVLARARLHSISFRIDAKRIRSA